MPDDLDGAMSASVLELEAQRASLERVLALPNISEALKGRIRPCLRKLEADLHNL